MFIFIVIAAFAQQVYGEITCLACQGPPQGLCVQNPSEEKLFIKCKGSCVVMYILDTKGRAIQDSYRGCASTIYPAVIPEAYRDSCKTDSSQFIKCSNTCDTNRCNVNLTAFADDWNEDGTKKRTPKYESPTTHAVAAGTYPGREITCLACQGPPQGLCVQNPSEEKLFIKCIGSCVVMYILDRKGRAIQDSYRGCASTIYPAVIPEVYRDSCKTDSSHFIECSNTCSTDRCNVNLTAFADDWNEDGTRKRTSKYEPPTTQAVSTRTYPGREVSCLACHGLRDSNCVLNPSMETLFLPCNGSCVVLYTIYTEGRALREAYRGCASAVFPHVIPEEFRNMCKTDSAHFIDCTNTCNTDRCNVELSAFTDEWNEDGTPKLIN